MIIASASQFHLPCLGTCFAQCLNSVLNVKALVGAFNQEKALVGAFSVIVQPVVEPMEHYTALDFSPPSSRARASSRDRGRNGLRAKNNEF